MTTKKKSFHLAAIGNACTDLVATVADDFLLRHGLRKSHCTYLTLDQLKTIKADLPSFCSIAGGVGGNVASVIAALGGRAAFLSKISKDPEGLAFSHTLKASGIEDCMTVSEEESLSPQVICLSTPDGDRSFASYDGVAGTMEPKDLDGTALSRAALVFFDGYTLYADKAAENFSFAHESAKKGEGLLCFNPCDVSVIEVHSALIQHILTQTDILICNYAESRALFGDLAPQEMAESLSKRYNGGALTNGSYGAHVFKDREVLFVPPPPTLHLLEIDSNGAGDHFAGGFLYALAQQHPLSHAGKLAQLCALDSLTHAGARPLGSLKHLLTNIGET
jgi:sugar/nucleoside kinase (ribokinase family)